MKDQEKNHVELNSLKRSVRRLQIAVGILSVLLVSLVSRTRSGELLMLASMWGGFFSFAFWCLWTDRRSRRGGTTPNAVHSPSSF